MDYLDIPDLQRRGIIKKKAEKINSGVQTEDGYVKISPMNLSEEKSEANPFSFLDNLASASTQTESASQFFPATNSSDDAKDMKVKFENFEYKLERLIDRLVEMERKFSEFERKVN